MLLLLSWRFLDVPLLRPLSLSFLLMSFHGAGNSTLPLSFLLLSVRGAVVAPILPSLFLLFCFIIPVSFYVPPSVFCLVDSSLGICLAGSLVLLCLRLVFVSLRLVEGILMSFLHYCSVVRWFSRLF